jgi:hypothetical protein
MQSEASAGKKFRMPRADPSQVSILVSVDMQSEESEKKAYPLLASGN